MPAIGRAAKIPDRRGFATKGELARDIARRCLGAGLPASWVTADEAYGQDWNFRRLLEQLAIGYVVAVPKSQQIKSLAGIWRIDELIDEAPGDAWQRLSCGDGAKGSRVYDWAAAKLPANLIFEPEPPTHHRWVMVRRSLSDPGQVACHLAYAPVAVELAELVRIAGSRWAIEECFKAAKNECGLEYEVRRYVGWYRHITLAMLAHAILAALAAQAGGEAAKGAAETDQLKMVGLAKTPPGLLRQAAEVALVSRRSITAVITQYSGCMRGLACFLGMFCKVCDCPVACVRVSVMGGSSREPSTGRSAPADRRGSLTCRNAAHMTGVVPRDDLVEALPRVR
ncbi:hypothetical protein QF030_000294 [Streptomyces rishiriensis]|uniref:Transposase IS701-like DDE domain-containing protein n=1 Tax=Streptomyces rishiriensis TaxID=68264 RepID=A0ABU0NG82_STRRH|nr:transposase [Streptomyces rishiriensis]MDQ0578116.1 hypothetical protein [Streptomyces rishiriensis]